MILVQNHQQLLNGNNMNLKSMSVLLRNCFFVILISLCLVSNSIKAQSDLAYPSNSHGEPSAAIEIPRKDKHFKVGLFLPFFKEGTDTTAIMHAFALSSLDYLAGVKAAVDSIEKTGNVNIDFFVEDTELDSSIVESLLNREEYRDLDVLIGPIFQSGVTMATPIIQKRSTIMYLPFEKDYNAEKLTNIISSQKNMTAYAAYFSSYFERQFANQNKQYVFLYNSKEGKFGREARAMDSIIKLDMNSQIDTSKMMIFDMGKKENGTLASKLVKGNQYVFFINCKNNYYVNEALAQIKTIVSSSPEVYCYFEVLESEVPAYETWDTLKVKFFSRFFVNFEDGPTGTLRKRIIESYNQDPVEFTYKGYNDILFLSQAFADGKDWLNNCLNKDYVNEVAGFYYHQDPSNGGIFNGYHAVWRYEKLKIYRQY